MVRDLSVSIKDVSKSNDLYMVKLELILDDQSFCIDVTNIPRPVSSVNAVLKGNAVYIELFDESGAGFASCVVNLGHVTRRCLQCKTLILPP